ncbi:hypothetical protein BLA24_05490 [Streptomyces cinnamoneus]|uniref:Uncharacterized protein n=1 Tax=Streptomyces cinnamoneus TaxID=53446 RepID=A0A2G1XNC3_STRCJ|nr:hypothetical protein BLA24_05490 [Streptomyces cinnamoneus]PPT11822.1 hypothetical protein CYQ11_01950 [Streptomyces cinnamoneus]
MSGHVEERDVKSLETWLKDEPELKGRVQVKRGARRGEAGVPMGPQLDIVLHVIDWGGAAASAEIVRRVAESVKEWRTSRRALGDPDPPDFRAERDDEQD